MIRARLVVAAALGLFAWPLLTHATVHEYVLDNGMKVLVKVDRRAPIVVSQVWYKVGSSYEHNGITGVSHVLEHMMFKGTRKLKPGEFSEIIAANGGRENAFTGRDYTAYFQQLEKSRLPIALELEADRMRNLTLPPEEFTRELGVVIEERRLRTEDQPRSLTYEQFNATAWTSSPYKQPIIGWMNDLENLKVEDLRPWYEKWYAPNNATLVVVGDVEPEAVHDLANRYFGPLPGSPVAALKPRREAPQRGVRRVSVRVPAELPYVLMGYKVPVLGTAEVEWEPYALEMVTGILSGGNSARLPRELVRGQQLAASAEAGYNLYARQDELFLIDATPASGHDVQKVEQAIRAQIERLKSELVSAQELDRIKAQVVAASVYEKDSAFYQAMELGQLATVGLGWRRAEEYVERVRSVTAEQVQAVVNKYFVDEGLTVAQLEPLSLESRAAGTQQQAGPALAP
ncbi:MAG: insulinase family protein [Pseudomonadota bacterium]|nr:MAG: insulinase family protein [Pseudomonadota bacterium]